MNDFFHFGTLHFTFQTQLFDKRSTCKYSISTRFSNEFTSLFSTGDVTENHNKQWNPESPFISSKIAQAAKPSFYNVFETKVVVQGSSLKSRKTPWRPMALSGRS